ncbi:NrgA, partial [Acinetobacter baumannii]
TLTLTFLPEIQQRYQLLEQYQGGWAVEQDYIMTWVFQASYSV